MIYSVLLLAAAPSLLGTWDVLEPRGRHESFVFQKSGIYYWVYGTNQFKHVWKGTYALSNGVLTTRSQFMAASGHVTPMSFVDHHTLKWTSDAEFHWLSPNHSLRKPSTFDKIQFHRVSTKEDAPAFPRALPGAINVQQVKILSAKAYESSLEAALDAFRLDCARYPATNEGLNALRQCPAGLENKWKGPYTDRPITKDPWGRPYVYRSPAQKGKDSFSITSYGPSGGPGSDAIRLSHAGKSGSPQFS